MVKDSCRLPWKLTSDKPKYFRTVLRVRTISLWPPKEISIVFHTTSKS
jgi:hypothetical protein